MSLPVSSYSDFKKFNTFHMPSCGLLALIVSNEKSAIYLIGVLLCGKNLLSPAALKILPLAFSIFTILCLSVALSVFFPTWSLLIFLDVYANVFHRI